MRIHLRLASIYSPVLRVSGRYFSAAFTQLLRFLRLAHIHATVFRRLVVERMRGHPHLSCHVFHLSPPSTCCRAPIICASVLTDICCSPFFAEIILSFVRKQGNR